MCFFRVGLLSWIKRINNLYFLEVFTVKQIYWMCIFCAVTYMLNVYSLGGFRAKKNIINFFLLEGFKVKQTYQMCIFLVVCHHLQRDLLQHQYPQGPTHPQTSSEVIPQPYDDLSTHNKLILETSHSSMRGATWFEYARLMMISLRGVGCFTHQSSLSQALSSTTMEPGSLLMEPDIRIFEQKWSCLLTF